MQELRTAPRQQRSKQSIDAILDAAERLIHDHGQVSFTAAELATEANMSIGRVYYWFPDIPAIVAALVDRTVERMVHVFENSLGNQVDTSTPMLVQRVADAMCDHIDRNPGTIALSVTGRPDGYSGALQRSLIGLVDSVVRDRVPGIPDDEVELVARTFVGITLGMLKDYTRAAERKPALRQELVYVLSSWLYARYPASDDLVWNDPERPVQPSRLPRHTIGDSTPVWPALSPRDPAGTTLEGGR